MALVTAARDHIGKAIIGAAATAFSNANAHIGVGNGSTAFSAAHTDLQGASKTRKAMDASFPTESAGVLTFKSTFATGDANHAWEEWGIFNGSSGATMLSRKVEALGTKTSAESKVATATLTLSV